MGNISLSHCKDAITIVWHKNKIGIDIERTDRDFNHINLQKNIFFIPINQTITIALTKNMILNQWCTVEAAIKWDRKIS